MFSIMPGLLQDLRKLLENGRSRKQHLKLIKWLQKRQLLKRKMKCSKCRHKMSLKPRTMARDHYAWMCQRARHRSESIMKAIRFKSIFSHSKNSLFEWMKFLYRFSQGLRLRQIDMIHDGIAGSSATLTNMAKKVRDVCVTAMERLRRRKGQRLGGQREFVVIDESHFRHKRKSEHESTRLQTSIMQRNGIISRSNSASRKL
ncbi:uncharacterized protein LOC130549896 isoform X1 [Triplophysa rosa]|uniref:uncharacterized protein LOC130549896 isoform X1 n=1 Tax=Triplophysa rosa TaxID=992332 RepID=UPI00254625DF|nr:uncharacterized protein LOC130549896 isoform X1 [Triplophysa rosa]